MFILAQEEKPGSAQFFTPYRLILITVMKSGSGPKEPHSFLIVTRALLCFGFFYLHFRQVGDFFRFCKQRKILIRKSSPFCNKRSIYWSSCNFNANYSLDSLAQCGRSIKRIKSYFPRPKGLIPTQGGELLVFLEYIL